MTDLKTALWCDLTTDAERSAWLLLGRGYETGVVAKAMQSDLARAYQRLAQPVSELVAEEREACAKVCDDLPVPPYVPDNDAHIWDVTCVDCAAAIRARGESDD
jgi:hypothetical protein